MGGSLFASGGISGATGGSEADAGKRQVRSQLAICDWDGMLFCCGYCWASVRSETVENITDIWQNDVSVTVRNYRHGLHAGLGIRDPILGHGCGIGIGVHAEGGVFFSFFFFFFFFFVGVGGG